MFLDSSRYSRQRTVDAMIKSRRTVKAITLRRLPDIEGKLAVVNDNDRLDIMAQRHYNDPAMFWHIADANTELEANLLVKTGRIIKVPEE